MTVSISLRLICDAKKIVRQITLLAFGHCGELSQLDLLDDFCSNCR